MKLRALVAANVAAVVGFIVNLHFGGVAFHRYGWDLKIVCAGARALFAGRNPYDGALVDDAALARFPFAYPPLVAPIVAPLVALPNLVALALLAAFGLLVLAVVAKKRALWVTASFPGLAALFAGQLVFVALAVFAAMHALCKRDRPFWAGVCASLLAFKPTLIVFVPIAFLITARWRALLGLAVGLVVQLAFAALIAPDALRAYPHAAAAFSTYVTAHPGFFDSVTWRATFSSDTLGAVAIGACAIAACTWMWRNRSDLDRVMSACVIATLACAWHCLPYDYALVVLPFVWMRVRDARVAWALVIASWLVLLPGNAHFVVLALYPPVLVATAWMMNRDGVIASRTS